MIELPHRPPSYLYPLQTDFVRDFYAGLTGTSKQFLIGPQEKDALILYFDLDGNYIGREEQTAPPPEKEIGEEKIHPTILFHGHFTKLQDERGFSLSTIRVKRFELEDLAVSIYDFPRHFQHYLVERPHEITSERVESLQRQLQDWMQRGDFVFEWGNDFYVNKHGIIVSS